MLHCRETTPNSAFSLNIKGFRLLRVAEHWSQLVADLKPLGPMYLHRKVSCTAAEPAWPCLQHCHLPMSTQSCWSPALHRKAAYGGIGWKRERVVGAEMEAGSGFGITLLLTWYLHLSPSFHEALLSISFHPYIHLVRRPLRPPHPSPVPAGLQAAHTPFLPSDTHTPCGNRQPGSPNASLGSCKKVDVFFRNTSSPAEQNFKGATSRSFSFPLRSVPE